MRTVTTRRSGGPKATRGVTYMTIWHTTIAWLAPSPPPWVCLHTALNIDGNLNVAVRLSRSVGRGALSIDEDDDSDEALHAVWRNTVCMPVGCMMLTPGGDSDQEDAGPPSDAAPATPSTPVPAGRWYAVAGGR